MPATSTLLSLPNEVLIIIAKYLVQPWNNRDSLRVGYGRFKRFPSRKDYDEVLATFEAWADAASEIPGNISPTLQNVLKRIEAITGFDFVHRSELISDLDEPTFAALQALSYCDVRQTRPEMDFDSESHYSRLQFVIPVLFCLVPQVKALSVIYRTEEHEDLCEHDMADAPKLDHVIAGLLADDLTSSKLLPELESLHFQSSAPSTGPQCHVFLPTLARLRSIRHMGGILARPLSQAAFQLISLDMSTTMTRTAGLLDVLGSCQDLERLSITLEAVSFRDESRDEVQVFIDELADTCLCPKLVSLRVEQKAHDTASQRVFEGFLFNLPSHFPVLRSLTISLWMEREFGPTWHAKHINIGSLLPATLEYLHVEATSEHAMPWYAAMAPNYKEGDMESFMPVLVSSWATVAAAIRAGHLPYLRYGFFLDECLGVLPGEISKVEEQQEETDDSTEETWTDERKTDSSPSEASVVSTHTNRQRAAEQSKRD
ncbi:hypothetical protein BN1708_010983 [Verticillium longisporum]|uniref:Uncharacterized protein n=1 Tax=Verticillium longisporum TaxID=100787 RepID=A0A0G4KWX3_VERLO|nr:hypothetical protein BN1708_010983 [Verticillium longisporum]